MNPEPFSFAVVAADIPAEGRRFHVEADADERSELSRMLDIPAIDELVADLEVRPVRRAYTVRGRLHASVVQTDVVSLEPIRQEVVEDVEVTLVPAEGPRGRRKVKEELVDPTGEDGPDLYYNGRIDLGVIVREHLALGLDPYPRGPGTAFDGHIEDDASGDASPFAALAALKPGGG